MTRKNEVRCLDTIRKAAHKKEEEVDSRNQKALVIY